MVKLVSPTKARTETGLIAARIPESTIAEFKAACRESRVSISEAIRQLITNFLNSRSNNEND